MYRDGTSDPRSRCCDFGPNFTVRPQSSCGPLLPLPISPVRRHAPSQPFALVCKKMSRNCFLAPDRYFERLQALKRFKFVRREKAA